MLCAHARATARMNSSEAAAGDRPVDPDALLARELGVRQLAANVFNYTVGSGIFALLGGAAPLAYLVCAAVIGLVWSCCVSPRPVVACRRPAARTRTSRRRSGP